MEPVSKSLCWAGGFLALAVANRFGLVADTDANVMFAMLPALWAAHARQGQCRLRRAPA